MFFVIMATLCIVASVSAHEIGHAIALRECGVRVIRISLLGLPGLGKITLPIRSAFFAGTEICVHPLLLGAYVQPDEEAHKGIQPADALYVAAMGPLVSILYLLVAIMGAAFLMAAQVLPAVPRLGLLHPVILYTLVIPACVAILAGTTACFVWRFRRATAKWVLFPLGCVVTVAALSALFAGTLQPGSVTQITSLVQHAEPTGTTLPSVTTAFLKFECALLLGGLLSAFIGFSNLIMLFPFDGGLMLSALLTGRAKTAHMWLTGVLAGYLMFLSLSIDFHKFFGWLTSP